MTQTVLLTGISGFIAKRIARDLLDKGYRVRGTIRTARKADEVRKALGPNGLDRLEFATLDLTRDAGWADAMEGVDALLHTASPFPMTQPKDEMETIRPAVEGTQRALKAALEAGVHRVVLTSSMVSIMHVDRPPNHDFGPEDWTDTDHPTASPYVKSKTLAEKAAWDFVKEHPEIKLTTIHPGLVTGQPMDRHYGTSLQLVERVLSGRDPMQPDISLPVVDIEDVSALHIAALEQEGTVGQRIIAADDVRRLPQIAELLARHFPDRKIATRTAPKFLLRAIALVDGALKGILPQVGRHVAIDNSASIPVLGRPFISSEEALLRSARFIDRLSDEEGQKSAA
ncbi:NAD-dependent epimerase/dehydratase family protein [Histidinibacterium aquaticum]|uniref:NAD-dependent epimerase/dehydratase family protein n=1 Tax=Histidinibacterium aquaticum TaxID=2613962 RepID=A0A5J5GHT0_9RHOB|nr:NAD-dependent epimerase/dehydratase family protein [Histidinibacterium aquaticum]KAA9007084.1 NAD-dependent epimerase/dehydratase family protein [Histidinibacterium aquaticum]